MTGFWVLPSAIRFRGVFLACSGSILPWALFLSQDCGHSLGMQAIGLDPARIISPGRGACNHALTASIRSWVCAARSSRRRRSLQRVTRLMPCLPGAF